MLNTCILITKYYYGMLVCSVLYYSITVVSLLFLGKIKFSFLTATVPLLTRYFLYSITLQQQYINSCDLNHSREIVNWVSNYLIPSITGEKTTAVSKKNRISR